jgi:hypothetical protein
LSSLSETCFIKPTLLVRSMTSILSSVFVEYLLLLTCSPKRFAFYQHFVTFFPLKLLIPFYRLLPQEAFLNFLLFAFCCRCKTFTSKIRCLR